MEGSKRAENDAETRSNCQSFKEENYPFNESLSSSIVTISRPAFTTSDFNIHAEVKSGKKTPKEWIKSKFNIIRKVDCQSLWSRFWNSFLGLFPFLVIISNYKKADIMKDVIAGLTIGVMHIPQGMAYGLLANLPPIYGLYTSFFPVIIYFFFGTSRQISIGTFAVISLMLGVVINKSNCERYAIISNSTTYTTKFSTNNPSTTSFLYTDTTTNDFSTLASTFVSNVDSTTSNEIISSYSTDDYSTSLFTTSLVHTFSTSNYSNKTTIKSETSLNDHPEVLKCKLEVAVTTTVAVGIIQLLLAVFKAGVVVEYLPSSVTRSLTLGAAVHIFTSQVGHVVGYSLGDFEGYFKLAKNYEVLFTKLSKINWATFVISLICIILIYLVQRFLNPIVKVKIRMPVPIDFLLLVVWTAISYGFKLSKPEVFNLPVVGNIPMGFPPPQAPAFYKLGQYFPDAIALAIISFIISYSLAKLFADIEKYPIDSNQELYAYAFMNIFSSFFSCYVGTASLSRSYVQFMAGGKTQVAGLVSCALLLIVIMVMGPLLHDLPKCVLAAIILINLKGLFLQIMDLKYHFKVSRYDGFIFVITTIAIVLTDVDIGVAIGLGFTFFSVVLRTQRPKVRTLGLIPDTDVYVDIKKFKKAAELENIKIISMETSLYYANHNHFLANLEVSKILELPEPTQVDVLCGCCMKNKKKQDDCQEGSSNVKKTTLTDIILDCSLISFIDADGISAINKVIIQYKIVNIKVSLASCTEKVYKMLLKAIDMEKLKLVDIYLTVQDAVNYITNTHHAISEI